MTRIVVAVLTWNGYDLARACLESLSNLREQPESVLVVDNGSRRDEGQLLADELGPPVQSLRLERNAAVAGGYNAAIRWAAEHDASHVLLLNNDTIVHDPDLLSRLISAAEPGVGAVGPIVIDAGGIPSTGGRLNWWTGISSHDHVPKVVDRPYTVDWLDGPCVLVSLDAVRQIGGLDPVFVSYWEDVDWCVRAGHAGYRSVIEPRTSIVHLGGGSIPRSEAYRYYFRNSILFMRRNGSTLHNVTSLVYYVFRLSPLMIWLRLRGRSPIAARTMLDAVTWNLRDAVRRRHWRIAPIGPAIEQMPQAAKQPSRHST